MRLQLLEAARRRLMQAHAEKSNETRPLAPILGEAVRVRTLHPPPSWRREVIDGATQPMMLDAVVTITLPLVTFGRGDVVPSVVVKL